jgi:hypothetical protein
MELFRRRSTLSRLVKGVGDSELPKAVKSRVAKVPAHKALASGVAAVGGLIGLGAGSAAVSARRRRSEKTSER